MLSEILVQEGETVEVGTVVARIQASGESIVEVAPPPVKVQQIFEEKIVDEVESPKVSQAVQSGSSSGNVIEIATVSYTHLRAHETVLDIVCRLLLEKNKHYNTEVQTTYSKL